MRALDAAHAAAPAWRAVLTRERSELLLAVFSRLIARADDVAALITAEAGKPLAEARAEVVYGAEFLRLVRRAGGARRRAGAHSAGRAATSST